MPLSVCSWQDTKQALKLLRAPGTVSPAKGTLFQFDGQFAVVRKAILRVVHFVVEEADCRQIRLDRAGGFVRGLQELHVDRQTVAADIRQLLQMILLHKEFAEAFAGFVIPLFRAETALTVMPRQFVKLGDERTVYVLRGVVVLIGAIEYNVINLSKLWRGRRNEKRN